MTALTSLVLGAQNTDTVDALVRLHEDGFIGLAKYIGSPNDPVAFEAFTADAQRIQKFFYSGGGFDIFVRPKGRLDLERREEASKTAAQIQHQKHARQLRAALLKQDSVIASLVKPVPSAALAPIKALITSVRAIIPEIPDFEGHGDQRVVRAQIAFAIAKIDEFAEPNPSSELNALPEIFRDPPDRFETALGTYKRIKLTGQGGSGRVFEVLDEDGNRFALKYLRSGLEERKRKRFRNEMRFCSQGIHPNIISILDWGYVSTPNGELPFFVMPIFPSTLRNLMKLGIPHDAVPGWFAKLLDGIEAAHSLSVWHRDLKPENVLCNPTTGELAITDFGIAHFAEDLLHTAIETQDRERLANFQYASPEQRSFAPVDHRADIYALGLMLNEMFTGELMIGSEPKRIVAIAPDFGFLDEIIDKMTRQSPEQRTSSIAEIKLAIGRQIPSRISATVPKYNADHSLSSGNSPDPTNPSVAPPIRVEAFGNSVTGDLSTAMENAESFRTRRLDAILAGKTPVPAASSERSVLVFHILPLDAFIKPVDYDLRRLMVEPHLLLPPTFLAARPRINFEGVVKFSSNEAKSRSYIQAFRTAGIEIFDANLLRAEGAINYEFIVPARYEPALRNYVNGCIAFLKSIGATEPYLLGFSLLHVKGARIAQRNLLQEVVEEDDLIIPSVFLKTTDRSSVDRALKQMFDRVWNAGGCIESPFFTEEGE